MKTISTAGDHNADWIKRVNPEATQRDLMTWRGLSPDSKLGRAVYLANAGKKCGDGFIEESDTCHAGESKSEKEAVSAAQKDKVDRSIADHLYEAIKKAKPSDSETAINLAEAKLSTSSNNYSDWRSRVKIYRWDDDKWDTILNGIDKEKWPSHGPMRDLVEGLQTGEQAGHDFMRIGKFWVNPDLRKEGVSHEDITKFSEKMASIYRAAGVHSQSLGKTAATVATKGKASSADILGKPFVTSKATQNELIDLDVQPEKHYISWQSAGAVVFRDDGKISIRKVKGGFGGYNYSFAKGRIDDGEGDEDAAHREVLEESGHKGKIIGDLGHHKGTASTTHFYLMKHEGDDTSKMDGETEHVEWVTPGEAADKLDSARDLRVLVKAMEKMKELKV